MDLILYNGSIITVDREIPAARAVAVQGGLIKAVGEDREILALRQAGTEVLDLQGKGVVPGFNDSHMHMFGYALTRGMVDLRRSTGIDDLIAAIRGYIQENGIGGGAWVFGWGWDQTGFREKRMPNREDLDRVSAEHSIVLMRTCGHVCSVNTVALKGAGIFESAPPVEGGHVDVDGSGKPTGILKEKAMDLVLSLFPPMDKEMLKALIIMAADDFLRAGLTSVQTDDLANFSGSAEELLQAYFELDSGGQMPLRVNAQLLLPSMDKLRAFLELGHKTGDGNDFFKIGPLKLLTDGSLGGRTAALAAAYADAPGDCGIPIFSREELELLVGTAHAAGMQVAAHAIGDGAIEMVLDAYKTAQEKYPRRDPRFRVIHASLARPDLLERFRAQGVVADIQPAFVPSDYPFIEERLGHKRADWAYCWKEFVKRGISLGGGSDCPVETHDPLQGLHAALTRQDTAGNPSGGWRPEQRLSLEEALQIYTLGSAYCTFEEQSKGSITPGKLADLVVLSHDIGRIEPNAIKDVTVEKTILNGRIVYSK